MLYRLRTFFARRKYRRLYPGAVVHDSAQISNSQLGSNITIASGSAVCDSRLGNAIGIGPNCEISDASVGRFSYFAGDSIIRNVDMGNFCSIARDFRCGLGDHPSDLISTSPAFYSMAGQCGGQTLISKSATHKVAENTRTKIGSDVWIGCGVFIRDGITIGDGVIVAAGSVVVKDVPPYSVVGGVAAKVIKKRFTDDQITKLLQLKWWNWNDDDLRAAASLIGNSSVNALLSWAADRGLSDE